MCQHLTDEQLLKLIRDDDQRSFEEIYRRYWEQMSLYVLKVIHSPEDACDIVQDVFATIWNRRKEIDIQSLKPYLLRSVLNRSLRHIQNSHRKHNFLKSLAAFSDQLETSSTTHLEFRELSKALSGVVSRLPPKMQQVYVLSRDQNLSHKEIAEQLGIAEATVKKQVSNALKMIRTSVNSEALISLLGILMLSF